MMKPSSPAPYLSATEPTFAEALSWWPEMTKPWGALGWKDHLFEFVFLWNGSLAMPLPKGRSPKVKDLDHLRSHEAQISFFPSSQDNPWAWGSSAYAFDDNSIDHEVVDNLPIMKFGHRSGNLLIEETLFCHVPGGRNLKRGDEPLFAWVRFEVAGQMGRVKRPEHCYIWAHVGAHHVYATMTMGPHTDVIWPAPIYPHGLAVVDGNHVRQTDGLARLGVRNGEDVTFGNVKGGPNSENFLRMVIPNQVGAHVDVIVPYMPVEPNVLEKEMALGRDSALEETRAFWSRELKRAASVQVPDKLAQDSFDVMPWQVFTLAERDPNTGEYILNTGAMHYEGIWATPFAAINGWALDYRGYHQEADRYLELFRTHQGEVSPPSDEIVEHDGFLTTPAKFETIKWISDHGAILYGSALHALLTRDGDFIKRWMPVWEKGLDWIRVQRKQSKKPLAVGVLPPGQATDDYYNYQFVWNDGWCYCGMRTVIEVLHREGHPDTAKWESEAEDYRKAFQKALRAAAKRAGTFETIDGETHPFVPTNLNTPLAPTNDDAFYLDTGPLFLVFAGLLPPRDPLVDAALAFFRKGPNLPAFRRESGCWQPPVLVHEISSCEPVYSWNVAASLERGDRDRFSEGLFSLLIGGQSQRILWDAETRNGVYGLVGTKPTALRHLRHSLVHETREGLELLRLPPRDWLRGDGITLKKIPTWFGPMSLHAWMADGVLHLEADLPSRERYESVVVHVPALGDVEEVRINNRKVVAEGGRVRVEEAGKRLRVEVCYC